MRWRRIAFWSVFGLFTALVLAISWLWMADLGVFKPQVERFVSEKTGREFQINGIFAVDLTRHSTVIAESVRMSNAEWAGDEDMVTIERVEVMLDLWTLFGDRVRVEMIDVDGARFNLARREDGSTNWDLLPLSEEDAEIEQSPEDEKPFDVVMRQVEIDDVVIRLDDAARTEPLVVDLISLHQFHGDDDFLTSSLDATLNGRVLRVEGEAGPWKALLEQKNVEFDVDATFDSLELTGKGHIDDLADVRRPSFEFTAAGPDVDDITKMLGIGEAGEGDIKMQGSFLPTDNGPLVLDVKGNIGKTEIEASGEFSDLQNLEEIDFDVLATGPDLGRILRIAGIHQVRDAPFMIDLNARRRGGAFTINRANMVFGEAQFEASADLPRFPRIDDSRIKLKIEGPDIQRFRYVTGLPGAATGAFSMSFDIEPDENSVEILDLKLHTSLGRIEADGRLTDDPNYFGSRFKFELNTDDLEHMGNAYGVRDLPKTPLKIAGSAEWTENGIRSIGDIVATVHEVVVRVDGTLAATRGIRGSDFDFRIEGPSLANLIDAFASGDGVPAQPYDLAGTLHVRNDGYRFRGVGGNVGTSTVKIDGLLARRPMHGSRFDFVFEGPAFEEIIDRIGGLEVKEGEYELSGGIDVQPDMLSIDDLRLERERGRLTVNVDLGLPASRRWVDFNVTGRGRNIRNAFAGAGALELNPSEWTIDTAGELRGTHIDFEHLNIDIGEAKIRAAGELNVEEQAARTEFSLVAEFPSLKTFGNVNGQPMREQPFSIIASVEGGDGELRIDNLHAKLGESDIDGTILYKKGDIPELEIDVDSDSLIFAPLTEEHEKEYDPAPEFDDGRLIPDIPVPLDALKRMNAEVSIDVGELRRDNLFMRNIGVRASLEDGSLNVYDAGYDALSGRLDARLFVSPVDDSASVHLQIEARDYALGYVELNRDTAMTGDIDIDLHGTGDNLRAVLGSMSGVFFMDARGGRMPNNRALRALYGDLLNEIVSTINPFYKSVPYTNFECIVLPVRIVNGQVGGEPHSYIATDKIRMTFKSKLDLKSEEFEMNVRTTPRRALSISAGELVNPFVKVVGTLASPRLALDEQGMILSGAAAVATGGLSILARAAWDRMSKSGDACGDTANEGREALEQYFPRIQPPEPATAARQE